MIANIFTMVASNSHAFDRHSAQRCCLVHRVGGIYLSSPTKTRLYNKKSMIIHSVKRNAALTTHSMYTYFRECACVSVSVACSWKCLICVCHRACHRVCEHMLTSCACENVFILLHTLVHRL